MLYLFIYLCEFHHVGQIGAYNGIPRHIIYVIMPLLPYLVISPMFNGDEESLTFAFGHI